MVLYYQIWSPKYSDLIVTKYSDLMCFTLRISIVYDVWQRHTSKRNSPIVCQFFYLPGCRFELISHLDTNRWWTPLVISSNWLPIGESQTVLENFIRRPQWLARDGAMKSVENWFELHRSAKPHLIKIFIMSSTIGHESWVRLRGMTSPPPPPPPQQQQQQHERLKHIFIAVLGSMAVLTCKHYYLLLNGRVDLWDPDHSRPL